MSSKAQSRFDLPTLKDLAGDRVFARGEQYCRDGMVDILGVEPNRIVARVAGTEDYRTVVTGAGTAVDGECSCPAFERAGFCKHMVAVALAANADAAAGETGSDGTLARVRAYLKTRGVDALVEMIVELAEWDPALLRKLEIGAAATGGDDKGLEKRLRTAIRDATRTGDYIDYGRAPTWAAGVEAALDLLAAIATGPRAPIAVELAIEAIDRIERAIDNIDDSDGHCTILLERAQEIHLDACRAAKPDPLALARDLYRREMEGDYDTFYGAAAEYADVLGAEGLAEYRRLAEDAWKKLPARTGRRRDVADHEFNAFRLQSILDFFAEREDNLDMRIALRAKNLSSTWAYLQLSEFCLAHGREDEALGHAEEGLWLFEDDRPDERLVDFAVDLLLKADRKVDAEAHLWRAFEKAPSLSLYGRLRGLGGKAIAPRAIEFLKRKLVGVPAARWDFSADLLVRVLIEEHMFEDAWGIVRDHGASRGARDALAAASEATHPAEALAVYKERIEELAKAGGNPAYEEAAGLIARMAGLQGATEQAAYVADVKERHRRKRNFMKLLG